MPGSLVNHALPSHGSNSSLTACLSILPAIRAVHPLLFRPQAIHYNESTRLLHADLTLIASRPTELGALQGYFGLILCNQVFEHVPQPFLAAKAIFALLRPGGLLFWTAPFIERRSQREK